MYRGSLPFGIAVHSRHTLVALSFIAAAVVGSFPRIARAQGLPRDATDSLALVTRADSLVLERSCYCVPDWPYRLRVSASGTVVFQSQGRSGITARDSVSPAVFTGLMRRANATGAFHLVAAATLAPTNPADGPRYTCLVADAGTVTVSIFIGTDRRTVADYQATCGRIACAVAGIRDCGGQRPWFGTVGATSRWKSA